MRKNISQKLILAIIIATSLIVTGCGNVVSRAELTKYQNIFFGSFDTAITLVAYCESQEKFDALSVEVESEFQRYNDLYDIYSEYPGMNNLRTINAAAGKEPVEVDQDIIDLLKLAKEMYEETDGTVNVAMGSVLVLWHNARSYSERNPEDAYLPELARLEKASEHCNIDDLVIDEQAKTVYLADPDMRLDVGAIAKGFAVEKVAQKIISEGYNNLVINAGGNIRVIGPKPDGDWSVGIQNPGIESADPTIASIPLSHGSVVTSGVYERNFTVDGVTYHHIIDPVTLFPENRYLAVSIITEDSGLADAMSTALFNMDFEEGKAYVASREDLKVIWVLPDGEIVYSYQ